MDSAHTFSKNYSFGGDFCNKDYTFYTNNLFFTTKDVQIFLKISFLVTCYTFSSVIRKHFEYNLNIFAKSHVKTQKSMVSSSRFQKPTVYFFFWIF